MKHEKLIEDFFLALERKNYEKVSSQLADDFTLNGALSLPIKKTELLDLQLAIPKSMLDLKFNLNNVIAKGDKILAKVQLSKPVSDELLAKEKKATKLSSLTEKKHELVEQEFEFSFAGDKISDAYLKSGNLIEAKRLFGNLDRRETTDFLE